MSAVCECLKLNRVGVCVVYRDHQAASPCPYRVECCVSLVYQDHRLASPRPPPVLSECCIMCGCGSQVGASVAYRHHQLGSPRPSCPE